MLPFVPHHPPPAFQTKASHFLGPLVSSGHGGRGWRDMTDQQQQREGRMMTCSSIPFPSFLSPFLNARGGSAAVKVFQYLGLQIHETSAKSYDKVEYLGAVGAAGWLVPPRPWESAQPCRVSGQSREKCSVRNLDGRKGGRNREMHLTLCGDFHL